MMCGASACNRAAQPAQGDSVMVEVRGPDGRLRLQLARAGDNFGDERLSWYAGPTQSGRLQRLPNEAGTASLQGSRVGVRRTQDGGLVLSRNGHAHLNVERRGHTLRLGNGDGFASGSIQRDGTTATLSGPSGNLQAKAEVKPSGVVVSDANGAVLGSVVGKVGPEEALMAFVPALQPVEQALLLATDLPATKLVKP